MYMQEEKPRELSLQEKLDQLKQELIDTIIKNSATIDTDLPVFYGHLIASLETISKDMSDSVFDDFIDTITYRLLDESKKVKDPDFIEKVCTNALRAKRKSTARSGIDIEVGTKLVILGDYGHAIPYLKPYVKQDAILGALLAYCYYMLSLREIADPGNLKTSRPGEMELLAREQMFSLAQKRPPFSLIPRIEPKEDQILTRAFWLMISCSLEWFPSEPGFFTLGIEKAKRDGNKEMRKELLKIAGERFFNEMSFLRESYYLNLEDRDPIGAAGIVKQMIQQYPEDLEPVYYGIKLSLLTSTKSTYETFRKLAVVRGMPPQNVMLLDLAFAVVSRDRQMVEALFRDIRKKYLPLHFLLIPLEFIVQEVFGEDAKRAKHARKVALESIEQFILQTIRGASTTSDER